MNVHSIFCENNQNGIRSLEKSCFLSHSFTPSYRVLLCLPPHTFLDILAWLASIVGLFCHWNCTFDQTDSEFSHRCVTSGRFGNVENDPSFVLESTVLSLELYLWSNGLGIFASMRNFWSLGKHRKWSKFRARTDCFVLGTVPLIKRTLGTHRCITSDRFGNAGNDPSFVFEWKKMQRCESVHPSVWRRTS